MTADPPLFGPEFVAHAAAHPEALDSAEQDLRCHLPVGLRRALCKANGGEGFVGGHYLVLWRAEDLARFNREYEVELYAPGFVFFGSTGGGEAFAFDSQAPNSSMFLLPFIGMSRDVAVQVRDSFDTLIQRMREDPSDLLQASPRA